MNAKLILQLLGSFYQSTVPVLRMAHRKWKEAKQPPGRAEPGNMLGCCLNSFHFIWAILSTSTVHRPTLLLCTEMAKIVCPRLRDPASGRGGRDLF